MKFLPYITIPFKVTDLSTAEVPALFRAQWSADKKTVRLRPELAAGEVKTYPRVAYWDVLARKDGSLIAWSAFYNSAEHAVQGIICFSIGGASSSVLVPHLKADCKLIRLSPTGKFSTAGLPTHDVRVPQARPFAQVEQAVSGLFA